MIILLAIILGLILLLLVVFYLGFLTLTYYLSWAIIIGSILVLILLLFEAGKVIFIGNAPYIRTNKKIIKKILNKVEFKENSIVYDLGCGEGLTLRQLVKNMKVKAIGYEYFIIPYVLAKIINFFSKNKIKIYFKDFFKADLSDADYIFCYLFDREIWRLEEKLKKELKPGAIVISNSFSFKNWQPDKVIVLDETKARNLSNKIFIYRR